MSKEIDIAALRKAAQKATRGPWKWTGAPGGWDAVAESGGSVICELRLNHPENAGHIAAANPAVILALLDRLEQAEKERDEILAMVPRTPEQAIEFVGGNFNSMQMQDEHGKTLRPEDVTYSLTVHDLMSAFGWAGFHDFAVKGGDKC